MAEHEEKRQRAINKPPAREMGAELSAGHIRRVCEEVSYMEQMEAITMPDVLY